MICLDLDKFKPVNDIFGHSTGDALLGEVALRLKQCVRRGDFVARQGGDNLCCFSTTPGTDHIEEVCHRIVQELNRPFTIDGNDVTIGVSMGIALAPGTVPVQTTFYAMLILRFIRLNNPVETDGSIIVRICRKS